jgi:hypothetical protein
LLFSTGKEAEQMQDAHAGRGRSGGSNESRFLLALALVVTTRAVVEGSPNPVSRPGGDRGCPLLEESAESLETVSRAEALARMEALVEANTAAIERLDGRWRAGDFGPPGSRVAERTVRRLARADLVN